MKTKLLRFDLKIGILDKLETNEITITSLRIKSESSLFVASNSPTLRVTDTAA